MSGGGAKNKKRGGLGRGLGALIPEVQREERQERERPVDILFPPTKDKASKHADAQGQSTSSVKGSFTGGSAKDLLQPRTSRTSVKEEIVSRETISENLPETDMVRVPGAKFGLVSVAEIIPNTKQPRQVFEQNDLDELAASIAEVGLLQPIVVRPLETTTREELRENPALAQALQENPGARYELIMGERRLRASQLAKLEEIPAIVRETEDEDLLRDALLENLHRVQLNPLEEAAAYQQLMKDFSCTQEELSVRIARSRPQIANTLRLLRLPPAVQKRVGLGTLSAGHARALLGLDDPMQIEKISQRVINEGLSVRATEDLVRLAKGETPAKDSRKPRAAKVLTPLAMEVADKVSDFLDTGVSIQQGKKKSRLVIDFADEADLQRIYELLLQR